jgi:disulfide bond formation protein DsbB
MLSPRGIALTGFTLGLLALVIALGSERFLGLIPCALCLTERWTYRFAMIAAIFVFILPRGARVAGCWLMAALFVVCAAAAGVHVGVEQHWWPSPYPECMAPNLSGLSPAERFARMPLRPAKSCEDADYPIPHIPITMAQANLLYALASAGFLTMLLRRRVPGESRGGVQAGGPREVTG